MTQNSWDTLAAWLDEKHGDTGDLWHRALIDPALLKLVGDVKGLRVLEVACGNGYLTRRFARAGAEIVGIDASIALIERAQAQEQREPLGIAYQVADATALSTVSSGIFDLVVCNMALMDIEDAAAALREMARVMHLHGRLVASLEHPCFQAGDSTVWALEKSAWQPAIVWRKVSRYHEIAPYACFWNDKRWQTMSYHRPLNWYMQALRTAGLALTALEEPLPQDELMSKSSQGEWIAQIPLHLVFEAQKIASRT